MIQTVQILRQVTVLESTDDAKQRLLVATAHFYFHPMAPHIRIIQAIVCLRHIERILAEFCSRVSLTA